VAPEDVGVARAELRQPLEELRLVRLLRLLPARLPCLVRGEEPLRVEVPDAQAVVLLERQGVVVLHLERSPRIPRERPAQLIARPPRLGRGVRVAPAPRLRCWSSLPHLGPMVSARPSRPSPLPKRSPVATLHPCPKGNRRRRPRTPGPRGCGPAGRPAPPGH